ncbi:MAG: hypothetical protein ACTSYI_08670, partial [Promethearchaeota archaeon]
KNKDPETKGVGARIMANLLILKCNDHRTILSREGRLGMVDKTEKGFKAEYLKCALKPPFTLAELKIQIEKTPHHIIECNTIEQAQIIVMRGLSSPEDKNYGVLFKKTKQRYAVEIMNDYLKENHR